MLIPHYQEAVPTLDVPQMIEVDRLMVEEYQINLIQMMENAGRCLAIVARDRFLSPNVMAKKVVVMSGTGNNAGGALVCARRLFNWGANIEVYLTRSEQRLKPAPTHQLHILKHMGVPVYGPDDLRDVQGIDLIIDGIIGYSLSGSPRGKAKEFIEWANQQSAPILSLDTPSGIDLTTGKIYTPSIHADATLTLALPKVGLYQKEVRSIRGELYLGDISVPPNLYSEPTLGLDIADLFIKSDVIRID